MDPEKKARMKGIRKNTGRTHFKKGHPGWNKGTKGLTVGWCKGIKLPFQVWNKGLKIPSMQNDKNPMWKGDEVSYRSLHKWVERHLGKSDTCSHCLTPGLSGHTIHWSNISGEYHRSLDDWQRLCAKCHGAYDSGKLILTEMRG